MNNKLTRITKIAYVEDEKSILEIGISMFKHYFPDRIVKGFNNPIDAMQDGINKDTEVLITDFQMPEMNGYELIQKLNTEKEFNGITIIVTGSPDSITEEIKENVSMVFIKPVRFTEIVKTIKTLLAQQDAGN